jgi:hypothetical protein
MSSEFELSFDGDFIKPSLIAIMSSEFELIHSMGTLQIHLSSPFMSSLFDLSFDGAFTNPSLITIHEQFI